MTSPAAFTIGDSITTPGANDIAISADITAGSVSFAASRNIFNTILVPLITTTGDASFNALGFMVGTNINPISVAVGGILTVGCGGNAYLIGTTGDGVVHCLPSNVPLFIQFNSHLGCVFPSPTPPIFVPPFSVLEQLFGVPGMYDSQETLGSDFYFWSFFFGEDYFDDNAYLYYKPSKKKNKVSKRNKCNIFKISIFATASLFKNKFLLRIKV